MLLKGKHRYLSTHCLHSLHDQCRLTCKICGSACVCDCHREQDRKPKLTWALKAPKIRGFRPRGTHRGGEGSSPPPAAF